MASAPSQIASIASDIASRCVNLGDEKNRVNYLTFIQKLNEACASYPHVKLLLNNKLPSDIYSCLASVSQTEDSKDYPEELEKLGYLHELQRFHSALVSQVLSIVCAKDGKAPSNLVEIVCTRDAMTLAATIRNANTLAWNLDTLRAVETKVNIALRACDKKPLVLVDKQIVRIADTISNRYHNAEAILFRVFELILKGQAKTILTSERIHNQGSRILKKLDANYLGKDDDVSAEHLKKFLNVKQRKNQNVQHYAEYFERCKTNMMNSLGFTCKNANCSCCSHQALNKLNKHIAIFGLSPQYND